MGEFSTPTFVLLTDGPPLRTGGHGCHVLAWNWMAIVGQQLKLVVTRRLNPVASVAAMRADLPVPSVFYPDLTACPFPRRAQAIKSMLEFGLFLLWLPRVACAIRASGAERLFAFFGGNSWFLLVTWLLARVTRLPLDVYLVDDLEESARHGGQPSLARWTRWFEPRLLRRAERVFAISPGYVDHLAAKYRVRAGWLPVIIPAGERIHRPYQPSQPDVRKLTFLGAVNPLYLEALRDCLAVIRDWNRQKSDYKMCLSLLTYADPSWLTRELGAGPELEIVFRCGETEFARRLRTSWALFLPYSFSAEVRVMVSTSFPTKLVDSFAAGRPVLVYGPPSASVPRYFVENGLPLCVTRREDLMAGFQEIASHDTPQLIEQYEEVIRRHHNAEAVRRLICSPPSSDSIRAGQTRT